MSDRQMILGLQLGNAYGSQAMAWRAPGVDPSNYTSFDAQVRYAQAAERGKVQFFFLPDFAGLTSDLTHEAPMLTLDPLLTIAAAARATERIGFVATGSTTFSEPYNLARQFKTLDIMSHGRIGWNAVTTSDATVAANYGAEIAPRPERYQRAHETIQIVQALWGSWGKDAWLKDVEQGSLPTRTRSRRSTCRGSMSPRGARCRSRRPSRASPSSSPQAVASTASASRAAMPAGSWGPPTRSRMPAPSARPPATPPSRRVGTPTR